MALLMVRREGKAQGSGLLNGAAVTEFGYHDILPGDGGDPRGYLVFTMPDADMAYVKWPVRAVFVPGADLRPCADIPSLCVHAVPCGRIHPPARGRCSAARNTAVFGLNVYHANQ